jgi:uncharacterized hydrophobic protein (TIGR00341 family)
MSLRLLEITVGARDAFELADLLAEREVQIHTRVEMPEEREVVRVVVPIEHTEALTDELTKHFGSSDVFGVVILAVEAVLPKPDEPEEEPEEPEVEDGGDQPPPMRVSREELYEDVSSAADLTAVYLATVALSTIVAAAGLIRGDVAVIIGAMVIAPLLGPTVAFALGLTLGDTALARLAAKASGAGIAVVMVLSMAIGLLIPVDSGVPELAARTHVGLADIAIAMAAGSAGSLAYTTGLPTAIIGVMVAVALLPPLVATGLLLGAGQEQLAAGSAVLVLVNITCVSLAAVGTFLVRRVRPRTWWEAEKAKKATRLAVVSWLALLAVLIGLIFLLDR